MEIFIVTLILFLASISALIVAQWVRKAPLPVGCTPENGECCQTKGGDCHRLVENRTAEDSQSFTLARKV